jgi:C-terminal processing protease CtpA/Prc
MGFAAEVKASLERYADEPTLVGRQARVHLSKLSVKTSIQTVRETGKTRLRPDLLPEVAGIAKLHYVDGKRVLKGEPDPKRPRDPVLEPVVDLLGEGMVEALDPFCVYMRFATFDAEQQDIGGQYGGIGATVTKRPTDDYIKINQPIYDDPAPAYRAGIRSGDWLVSADGKDLRGMEIDQVVDLLKGPPSTSVMVGYMREGWKEPKVVPITRALIAVNTAKWDILPGNIVSNRPSSPMTRSV